MSARGASMHPPWLLHACTLTSPPLLHAEGAIACGSFVPSLKTRSNFGKLRVVSFEGFPDELQMQAAGWIEGYLSAPAISDHCANIHAYFDLILYTDYDLTEAKQWLVEQVGVAGRVKGREGRYTSGDGRKCMPDSLTSDQHVGLASLVHRHLTQTKQNQTNPNARQEAWVRQQVLEKRDAEPQWRAVGLVQVCEAPSLRGLGDGRGEGGREGERGREREERAIEGSREGTNEEI